ncbi:hypothetical protein ACFPKZ_03645 [Streptosporangium amethystogenes subsp. fukuiense]|uniref:hypothetical protein n=1 Tax=Streptosporangium amethystogenes TaxID=2002 RepID=UPI003616D3FE
MIFRGTFQLSSGAWLASRRAGAGTEKPPAPLVGAGGFSVPADEEAGSRRRRPRSPT